MLSLELEELALSEWPALETQFLSGWILRFSRGYTKRSNSVSPLYGKNDDLREMEAKIRTCEEIYGSRGLSSIFKLTGDTGSPLDSLLEQRGYTVADPSLVMTRDLSPDTLHPPASELEPPVEILPGNHTGWLAWASAGKKLTPEEGEVFRQLSSSGAGKIFHAWLRNREGHPLSGATGVVNRGWLGILNVYTPEAHRRQGCSRRVLNEVLAAGAAEGAGKACLAVVKSNTAALNLYTSLGFVPSYTYWYRIKK